MEGCAGLVEVALKPVITRALGLLTLKSFVLEPALGGLDSPDSLCGLQLLSLLFQRICLLCQCGTLTHL